MTDRSFSILIVSPDRPLLARLSRFLEAFGYAVRQATEMQPALAAAQAQPPDFLIVDGAAEDPADLRICREIRKLPARGYAFSLLITGDPQPGVLTEALEAGFDDFLSRPVVFGELLARLRAGARVIEFERRLAAQSGVDPESGLPDRGALLGWLRDAQHSVGTTGWLAVAELDYFDRIARQHGEAAGDAVLREALQTLGGNLGSGPRLASLGGQRLAALGLGAEGAGGDWATAALARLTEHEFHVGDHTLALSASCGLTEWTSGEPAEAILARAERALALARSSGRNCVRAHHEALRDDEDWTALASGGNLFETTLVRDVMAPCPLVLGVDETIEQAAALAETTQLAAIPVVDPEGRLAGIVTAAQLEALRTRSGRPRGGSSVRLLRHVMTTDIQRFDESSPLSELVDFFTGNAATLAVVVRDRRPVGTVHCQGVAALNERLSVSLFSATAALPAGTSDDLVVPDLAIAE